MLIEPTALAPSIAAPRPSRRPGPNVATGDRLGNFILERVLSDQGTSRLYVARHRFLESRAALKVLFPENSAEESQLWIQHARSLFHLRHPNLAGLLEYGEQGSLCYIASEYVDGPDLAWVLEHYGRRLELIPWQDVVGLFDQISSALDYLSTQEIAHGNLKPSNILLDRLGRAVLTDFAAPAPRADQSLISARYAAPELFTGAARATSGSDVYALGVVLYELLTGGLPFDGDTPAVIGLKHRTQPPPQPRSINPWLDPALEEVALRALSKLGEARYQSGEELARALHAGVARSRESRLSTQSSEAPMLGPRLRQVLDSYQGSIEPAPPTRPMDEPPQRPARTARFLMAMVATALLGVFCGATVVAFVRLAELWPQTQPAPSPADLVTAPSAAPSADSPMGIGDSQTPTSEEPTAASTEPTALALAPSAVPNVQMVLDGESVTVINISGDRLTLDGVAFKRVALDGAVTASFRAANWNRVAAYPVGQLPPGDC